jgi:hypothetical protein
MAAVAPMVEVDAVFAVATARSPSHTGVYDLAPTVFSDPATDDDTVQRDRLAGTTLQTEQARTITAGISTRQVAYLQPLHPDRHRVRVVGIVVLGNQHRIDGVAYPLVRPARTHQAPQILLVVRLADHFQIVTAVEERNLGAIPVGLSLTLKWSRGVRLHHNSLRLRSFSAPADLFLRNRTTFQLHQTSVSRVLYWMFGLLRFKC